jgi:hypothetical protein
MEDKNKNNINNPSRNDANNPFVMSLLFDDDDDDDDDTGWNGVTMNTTSSKTEASSPMPTSSSYCMDDISDSSSSDDRSLENNIAVAPSSLLFDDCGDNSNNCPKFRSIFGLEGSADDYDDEEEDIFGYGDGDGRPPPTLKIAFNTLWDNNNELDKNNSNMEEIIMEQESAPSLYVPSNVLQEEEEEEELQRQTQRQQEEVIISAGKNNFADKMKNHEDADFIEIPYGDNGEESREEEEEEDTIDYINHQRGKPQTLYTIEEGSKSHDTNASSPSTGTSPTRSISRRNEFGQNLAKVDPKRCLWIAIVIGFVIGFLAIFCVLLYVVAF